MKKIFTVVVLGLFALTACQPEKNRLSKLWFYTFSEAGTKRDTLLSPASFLLLRPDGSYTRDFGSFEYGNWKVENGLIILTSQLQQQSTLSFTQPGINSLQLALKEAETANFESMPVPGKEDGPDPFSTGLNQWRIPAAHKESREEIRERMLNHCRFWEAYFSWALANKLSTVDVRSTPTNIKIYGNGFGLKHVSELPPSWKACFYDEEDCQRANEEVKFIFEKETIAWAKTDNKYKMFISAFQQLQQYLR